MKILLIFAFIALASCDFPLRNDWQSIPPAHEALQLHGMKIRKEGSLMKYPSLKRDPGRIVNGQLASAGQFPFQILKYMMRADGAWFWCGGVIIGSDWVLTAAHCIFQRVEVELYAGFIDRQATAQWWSGRLPVNHMISHPQYNAALLDNDIGLVRTASSIPFTALVNLVPLPLRTQTGVNIAGMPATASGFGAMQAGGPGSQFLRWWTQPVAPNNVCISWYSPGWFRQDQNICIDPSVTRMSACQGDSGGPLTIDLAGRRVFGVFSFTPGVGCDLGFPEAWVRVTSYLDWINSHTGLVP